MRKLQWIVVFVLIGVLAGATVAGAQDGSSREQAVPLGSSADVGDGDFTVQVVSFNIHRTGELVARDRSNPDPEQGHIYALVTIEMQYHGKGTANGVEAGPFAYVDTGNVELSDSDCGTSADPVRLGERNDEAKFHTDLFAGGSTRFSECIQVTPAEAENLFLYVADGNGGDVFFALGPQVQPSATPVATPQ